MEAHMANGMNDNLDRPVGSTGSGMGGFSGSTQGTSSFGRDDSSDSLRERGEDMLEHGRERGEELLEQGRERVSQAADAGRSRVAGKLEEFGDRLEERGREAQGRGGMQGRAGQAAVRAGEALDGSADYLRSHDMEDMRDDLERQIRGRPLMSVGVALGAGFLLGRILRD
jgi:ElaB/YqjD/DUF883 family membrane-anchored ribosome-binding protein